MALAPDQHIIEIPEPTLSRMEPQSQLEVSPPQQLQFQMSQSLQPPSPAPQPQSSSKYPCIYKVPETLRKVNSDAYTPQLISIGPIHHGKRKLKSMEGVKKSYSDSFWKRVRNEQADQEEYRSWLAKEEQIIRKCYSEEFTHFNGKEFVDIILLDSVFIMELFLRFFKEKKKENAQQKQEEEKENTQQKEEEKYFILSNEWRDCFIRRDLLLLENQLPFNVLDKLYTYLPVPDDVKGEKQKKLHTDVPVADDERGKKKYYDFVDVAEMYFEFYCPQDSSLEDYHRGDSETRHFTDLLRNFFIPLEYLKKKEFSTRQVLKGLKVLRTATKLKKSGITFQPVKKCLLDIDFEKGPLSRFMLCFSCIPSFNSVKARFLLPTFRIDGTTEWTMRNLIALEQCHYPRQAYVCNYITLFDCLINSREDVDLLVESQVISHELSSDKEVAVLINGLCKNVAIAYTCSKYNEKIEKVNKHYNSSWNVAMAELRSVYYRDLWRGSSTIVGLAVLFFTFYNFFRNVIR